MSLVNLVSRVLDEKFCLLHQVSEKVNQFVQHVAEELGLSRKFVKSRVKKHMDGNRIVLSFHASSVEIRENIDDGEKWYKILTLITLYVKYYHSGYKINYQDIKVYARTPITTTLCRDECDMYIFDDHATLCLTKSLSSESLVYMTYIDTARNLEIGITVPLRQV